MEYCGLCGRVLLIGESVHQNERGTEFLCIPCYDIAHALGESTPRVQREDAEALAGQWVRGETSPEELDPMLREWKTEAMVREAVKTGDLHRKQVDSEMQRRRDAGRFDRETPAFTDQYPKKEIKA